MIVVCSFDSILFVMNYHLKNLKLMNKADRIRYKEVCLTTK